MELCVYDKLVTQRIKESKVMCMMHFPSFPHQKKKKRKRKKEKESNVMGLMML